MRNDCRYLVSILYIIRNLKKRDKAEINGPTAMKKKMVLLNHSLKQVLNATEIRVTYKLKLSKMGMIRYQMCAG